MHTYLMDPVQNSEPQLIPPPVSELQTPPPTPKSKMQSRLLMVIAVLAVLLLSSLGVFYVLQAQKNNITPTTITQPSPTPTPDPTENWKTYTNKDLTISFSYPNEWEIKEESENQIEINESSKQNPITYKGVTVSFIKPYTYSNLQDFLWNSMYTEDSRADPIVTQANFKDTVASIQPITINNHPAEKASTIVKPVGSIGTGVLIPLGKNAVFFLGRPVGGNEEVLDQILSTFKFTDQASSTSAEDVKNLPKEQCGCWDDINNVCLNQSACL